MILEAEMMPNGTPGLRRCPFFFLTFPTLFPRECFGRFLGSFVQPLLVRILIILTRFDSVLNKFRLFGLLFLLRLWHRKPSLSAPESVKHSASHYRRHLPSKEFLLSRPGAECCRRQLRLIDILYIRERYVIFTHYALYTIFYISYMIIL